MPVIGEAKGVRRDCLDDDAVEGPVEFVTWNNGGDRFAAIGRNVYRFNGGRLTGATRMKYPGCLRFMPYADKMKQRSMTLEQIAKRCGPIPESLPDDPDQLLGEGG